MDRPLVTVEEVEKVYRLGSVVTPALRGVSLELPRGSFTAVVGPSGCGKTTLLSILGALDHADAGRVVVDGLDLTRASPREVTEHRRRKIGLVFQGYNLLPSLTALENVESGLEFLPLRSTERRRRARDTLARVGLAHLESRFPSQLSGGQQQRVAVARALARHPALLLADEPTGNLDQESGALALDAMGSLQRELGVTCLVVTHDVALAERADAVVRLRDGAVEAAPRHSETRWVERSGPRLAASWR